MIVVDANVLAYFYIPTPLSEAAADLHDRDPHWVAPVLWRSEFRSVLLKYLRRRTMTLEQARKILEAAESKLAEREFHVDSASVLKLARESDCSVYDCEYVALAIDFDVKLATMDGGLLRAFPDRALPLATP